MYPLLLFILNQSDTANRDQITGMLIDIESYIFRRAICGLTPKNYNNIFIQIIRDLLKLGFSRENLQRSFCQLGGEATLWPDERRFSQAWMARGVYNGIKPVSRLVVVLRAVEDALRTNKTETILIHSPLTVEHVMPQDWVDNWPLSDGTFAKAAGERILANEIIPEADERDRLIHSFGNLTLLTQPLNSSVSNSNYSVKCQEICKQSSLALNRYFQDVSSWDVDKIRERGQRLLEIARQIWPYPVNVPL